MSKVKQEQIEQWRFESAEIRKHLGKLEKQIEAIKARKKIVDPRFIKEKRRNTERNGDATTITSASRKEDQSQNQSTKATERRFEEQKRGQCKCWS